MRISMSVGIEELSSNSDTGLDVLLSRADQAMYEKKRRLQSAPWVLSHPALRLPRSVMHSLEIVPLIVPGRVSRASRRH